jgi:hypothetical protein
LFDHWRPRLIFVCVILLTLLVIIISAFQALVVLKWSVRLLALDVVNAWIVFACVDVDGLVLVVNTLCVPTIALAMGIVVWGNVNASKVTWAWTARTLYVLTIVTDMASAGKVHVFVNRAGLEMSVPRIEDGCFRYL